MVIPRNLFFLTIGLLLILPAVTYKLVWLLKSEKTTGILYFHGRGNALDQMRISTSYVYFKHGKDTIWFTDLGDLPIKEGSRVSVIYQKRNPSDARINTFLSVWGTTVFYYGVPLLMLVITAIHPGVVPYDSNVRVTTKRPFVDVVPNDL